jgi:Aromatic-ring-opening dioxygenase LigAB, LigA subunit
MSLYGVQKFLFHLNRDPRVQQRFKAEPDAMLDEYPLEEQERAAIRAGDIGLIYVLGANGQLLMHYAAFLGLAWPQYIQAMRDGVAQHGPVRAGVYAMTTTLDEKVAGV